ncbi:MAG: GTP 3',8-cyclase MoaA [Verrucomicrobia subdivision 3 bacterium]|nr:GTP 3',8-cyclase MoaA [Limisphaerales bacterium]
MSEKACHLISPPPASATQDTFGRVVDYLRVSITDRCNERCLYCMPEGYKGWERKPDHLTAEEIVRVVRVAAGMGFRKFRLTGGEPLVRADVPEIVRTMAAIPGVEHIGISTNGSKLGVLAQPLRDAGVGTVNVSLDALDPAVYRRITGGDLNAVLAGIRAAVAAGFERVKLNCVLMRGVNEHELWPLVLFAAEHGLPLRLIELMPVTTTDVLTEKNFMPVSEAMELLRLKDELIPQPDWRLGFGPAKYYQLKHTGARVGFIGAMTNLHFCETCNKMRLTADGKVRPCLGDHGEIDLREALRHASDDVAVRELLASALQRKPLEHQFRGSYQPCRPMTAIGG